MGRNSCHIGKTVGTLVKTVGTLVETVGTLVETVGTRVETVAASRVKVKSHKSVLKYLLIKSNFI
jgi:hypothetical protein